MTHTDASTVTTMRAIVQDSYGSTEVLRLDWIPRPQIADDEVLVQVRAAGLDRGTWHLMTGQPYLLRAHSFRRTVATVLDRAGGADRAAEMLGLTSSDITKKHYIEPDEAVNPVTAEILESLAPRRTDDEI